MWWPVVGTSSLARQISGVGRRWSEPPPCPEFEMERCTESLPSCQHRHRLRLISEPSVPHRTAVTSSSSRKQRRISPFFPFAAADAHASSHAPHVVGVLCFSPPPHLSNPSTTRRPWLSCPAIFSDMQLKLYSYKHTLLLYKLYCTVTMHPLSKVGSKSLCQLLRLTESQYNPSIFAEK